MATRTKAIITCAPTGAIHTPSMSPHLPVTAEQIARAAIDAADRFDRMAIDRALANLTRGLRDLSAAILSSGDGPVEDRIAAWKAPRAATISRMGETVADLIAGDLTISRLSVAAGLLSDLATS